MGDMREIGQAMNEHRRDTRAARLALANSEFHEFAKIACSGDMTLRAPAERHWTLSRSQGKTVIAQYWPSAEKLQLATEKRSRHCTLGQFRAMLHDKLGCPPVLKE